MLKYFKLMILLLTTLSCNNINAIRAISQPQPTMQQYSLMLPAGDDVPTNFMMGNRTIGDIIKSLVEECNMKKELSSVPESLISAYILIQQKALMIPKRFIASAFGILEAASGRKPGAMTYGQPNAPVAVNPSSQKNMPSTSELERKMAALEAQLSMTKDIDCDMVIAPGLSLGILIKTVIADKNIQQELGSLPAGLVKAYIYLNQGNRIVSSELLKEAYHYLHEACMMHMGKNMPRGRWDFENESGASENDFNFQDADAILRELCSFEEEDLFDSLF